MILRTAGFSTCGRGVRGLSPPDDVGAGSCAGSKACAPVAEGCIATVPLELGEALVRIAANTCCWNSAFLLSCLSSCALLISFVVWHNLAVAVQLHVYAFQTAQPLT